MISPVSLLQLVQRIDVLVVSSGVSSCVKTCRVTREKSTSLNHRNLIDDDTTIHSEVTVLPETGLALPRAYLERKSCPQCKFSSWCFRNDPRSKDTEAVRIGAVLRGRNRPFLFLVYHRARVADITFPTTP